MKLDLAQAYQRITLHEQCCTTDIHLGLYQFTGLLPLYLHNVGIPFCREYLTVSVTSMMCSSSLGHPKTYQPETVAFIIAVVVILWEIYT